MPSPRFEIAHRDTGWYGRFIAANGREVWRTSDPDGYKRKAGVQNAIESLVDLFGPFTAVGDPSEGVETNEGWIEFRDVDERTPDPADLPPEEAGQALLRTPIDTPEET